MTSLCLITPTVGRRTLRQAIESADLSPTLDSHLVISDGPQPEAKALVEELKQDRPWLRYIEGPTSGNYGNALRDLGMDLSTKDFFIFLDDDDILTRDAIPTIRDKADRHPGAPMMFRLMTPSGETIWRNTQIDPGNTGGSMLVLPNNGKRARWGNYSGHNSDNDWMLGTMARYGEGWRQRLVWCGETIIRCKGGVDA